MEVGIAESNALPK